MLTLPVQLLSPNPGRCVGLVIFRASMTGRNQILINMAALGWAAFLYAKCEPIKESVVGQLISIWKAFRAGSVLCNWFLAASI